MSSTVASRRRRYDEDPELQAVYDRQPGTTRCLFCSWAFEGTAAEGRVAAVEHRRTHALEAKPAKRLSQGLTAEDRREAIKSMTDTKPAEAEWTREKVIAAIQAWTAEHGKPPSSTQWQGNRIDGPIPPTWKVTGLFGRWSKAIVAAGLSSVPTDGAANGTSDGTPEAPISPEPAKEAALEPPKIGTLVELAQAVEDAQVELLAANLRRETAMQALRVALEAAA